MDTLIPPPLDPLAIDLATVPLERIETELSSLSAHLAAAECRWLLLLAEFDRRGGWQVWGCHSAVHWMGWKLGVDRRTAQEKLRVAHQLVECPQIAEAFSRGELSYSKVRAITRIATPETEETLLMWCRHGTAAHIERICAGKRSASRGRDAEARRRERDEQSINIRYDDDGWGTATVRAPAETLPLLELALRHSLEQLEQEMREVVDPTPEDGSAEGSDEPADLDDEPGGDEKEREGLVPVYVLDENDRMTVRWEDPNASAVPEPPPEPTASPAFDLRSLGADWKERPYSARKVDALAFLASTYLENLADATPSGDDRYLVNVHVGIDELVSERGAGFIEDGPDLSPETIKRLLCNSATVGHVEDADGNPLYLGRKSRRHNRAQQRAANSRDRTCRFPGCERTSIQIHHTDEWHEGGHTDIDKLVSLCPFHHHLCHEGGFRCEVEDGLVRFFNPDGIELSVEPLKLDDPNTDLVSLNLQLGLDIDNHTNEIRWDGSHPDYDLCMTALFSREGAYRQAADPVLN